MKRMCIKTLPPLLCIQLKRFGYDWEANRALKFDDYFKVHLSSLVKMDSKDSKLVRPWSVRIF